MRKLTKTELKKITLRESRILRLRFIDDCFHLAEDVETPDDLLLIRLLEEARRLENLINKSSVNGKIEPMKIEVNNLPVNETIEKNGFIQTLKQTSGNERESLKRAKLYKLTTLNMAVNDATSRRECERASSRLD